MSPGLVHTPSRRRRGYRSRPGRLPPANRPREDAPPRARAPTSGAPRCLRTGSPRGAAPCPYAARLRASRPDREFYGRTKDATAPRLSKGADHEHHVASVIRITGLHAAMCDNVIARIVPDGGVDRAADQDRAEGSTPRPPRPLRCAPARPAGPGHSPGKAAAAPRIERPSRAIGSCWGVG